MSWPSAIFFGELEIRDSHFCQRALNISTSLHVPAWIDTERVRVHHGGLAILRHAARMTEIGRIEMLALYLGADSMHDARTDLARMTGQCRGDRLQKAVAAVNVNRTSGAQDGVHFVVGQFEHGRGVPLRSRSRRATLAPS